MSRPPRIEPRTLKGFRDYLPDSMIPRERLMGIARHVFRTYGFSPIDTPAIEYLDVLTGKGGAETDKQLYQFETPGGQAVGLRFDLTVPLARFAAQHVAQLGTPFKRYHIAPVWRGENPQRGRYREFAQCDFDTIGSDSIYADIETTLVIHDLMRATGFEKFTIHINNRMVLSGLLERLNLTDKSTGVLRALDKLDKIPKERVAQELYEKVGANESQVGQILSLAELTGTNEQLLAQVEPLVSGSETGETGVAKIRELVAGVCAAGVDDEQVRVNVAIARGLDYYTGTVFETLLDDLRGIGSVCSGGRYDDLAGIYTRQRLPGIGASLGLDRLLAAMEELDMIEKVATTAPVFLPFFDPDRLHDYLRLAASLRAARIGVELYPEPKRLGQQLKYADRRGFRAALVIGSQEWQSGICQLKNLDTGQSQEVSLADDSRHLISALRSLLEDDPSSDSRDLA